MNYAEMSDFEINCAVAKKLGVKFDDINGFLFINYESEVVFNPCNSWAAAGPIIAEHQISIIFDVDSMNEPPAHWVMCRHVSSNGDVAEYYDQPDRPLRAAMIVFLMMMQESK